MATSSPRPVALVTAAGRGIGAACARTLAGIGYDLVLLSPSGSAARLAEELGQTGMRGSITNPDDLARMADLALDRHGRIDAVVANTGILPSSIRSDGSATGSGSAYDPTNNASLSDINDAEWRDGFEMMFLSVARLLRLTVPVFQRQGGGAVVAISTFTAPEPRIDYPVASCIRASLTALIKLHADRYGRDGIRINGVMPGYIENWDQPASVVGSIPMSRLGALSEVAETVAFLLSEKAGYITGQNILVDGGVNRSAR
jgi:NAD(P)-dependent dehydrogenase (short-subunit alcohol dehydrogenase family)